MHLEDIDEFKQNLRGQGLVVRDYLAKQCMDLRSVPFEAQYMY